MKELTLAVLAAILVAASGFLIKVPTSANLPSQITLGSKGWVHIQKLILRLFDNVCETSADPIIIKLAQDFVLDSGEYTDPNAITNFKNLQYGGNLLPKGEIFSEYNSEHWNEVEAMYAVMYYAKDFDIFYKAAAWARQNVNCGLFVDAIYLAIINRRDTTKVSIPAPYELLPNYFIKKDIIVKASSLLAGEGFPVEEDLKYEGNAYVLDANYTSNDNDEESKLAYFREDIGLNSYYFFKKLKLAPWLNTPSDINNKYGEYLYQTMKQLTARYDLERYANGLPELESIRWESPVQAYDPMLIYSNGHEFMHRMFDTALVDSHGIEIMESIENNISTVVSHMRQTGYNKTQIINHLMEIFVTSPRSYETLARQLLNADSGMIKGQYSVLYHLMTSQRDPVFWKLNKRIVEMIDNALKIMPKYSRNELYFPGVEIIYVDTKKMMTQFDNFQFDVTDALKLSGRETSFQVKINQPRLNHKPFVIKVNISSMLTGQRGLVKIYLGPKVLPGELAAKKNSFVLLDLFEINLKKGTNLISRSSAEMTSFSNDFESLRTLRKQVEDAEFGFDTLPHNIIGSQIGYPSRLILPRGSPDGLPLEIFVFVAPFSKASIGGSLSLLGIELNTAVLSPGFPLDLVVEDHELFNLPNAFIKDIVVTHKGDIKSDEERGGNDKKWTGRKSFDPSSRPDYSAKRSVYNKDEIIENEEEAEILPDTNNGLLGLRPDFTKRKETVENSAMKGGLYRKKNDYETRNKFIDTKSSQAIGTVASENKYSLHSEPPNYKERGSYDNTAKKEKYENKNYTKKYEKYLNKETNQNDNISTDDLVAIDLEKDVVKNYNNLLEKYKSKSSEIDDSLNIVNDHVTKLDNDLLQTDIIEEPPKKRWTIFDYFIPSIYESSDEKVYE